MCICGWVGGEVSEWDYHMSGRVLVFLGPLSEHVIKVQFVSEWVIE